MNNDSTWINIVGVGTFSFLTATETFFNDGVNTPGLSRAGPAPDLFDGPTSSVLDGWDMLTSIGPVGGTMYLTQWDVNWDPVFTDGGRLLFNSGSSAGTFEAVVVPEPSGLVLLSLGLIGYGLYRRRLIA
jgi:hypothetical protein